MGITTQIIGLIACLAFLVITHEFGHFAFARIFKVRVDKFYMFFNPGFSLLRMKKVDGKWRFKFFSANSESALVAEKDEEGNEKKDKDGKVIYRPMTDEERAELPEGDWRKNPENTEWGIGWLPLGGYCAINGMVDETTKPGELPAEPQPWEYRSKPAWQRLFIITGGVLVNFITALVLYVVILFTWGEEYIPVQQASYGYHFSQPALAAGFEHGDKIIDLDGYKPERLSDINSKVLIDGVQRVKVSRTKGDRDTTLTVYLPKDFAKKIIGMPERKDQYFCNFEIPFILDSVPADSPAAKAGMQKNDQLVGLDSNRITSYYDFKPQLEAHAGKAVSIVFLRGGHTDTALITLNKDGLLGVYIKDPANLLGTKHLEYGFLESIPKGISRGFSTLSDYVKQFKLVFTKEGATQLGGFGTIGSIFPKTWDWGIFWNMTAFIAIILAFMNFLPIPALDGGYILFILVEIITRRKPSDKFIGIANTIGFILLLALLIYANGLDILRAFK
ncbi:MAG: RIP metalloprotease RseP [Bacteroidales bacterium]|nr:RIP metalloprotease RseP [Bacteroidales bacterium]